MEGTAPIQTAPPRDLNGPGRRRGTATNRAGSTLLLGLVLGLLLGAVAATGFFALTGSFYEYRLVSDFEAMRRINLDGWQLAMPPLEGSMSGFAYIRRPKLRLFAPPDAYRPLTDAPPEESRPPADPTPSGAATGR